MNPPSNLENHQFLQLETETSRLQDLYLELLLLTPIFLLFFILYTTENTFVTLILYQGLLAIAPPIYLKYLIKTPLKPFYLSFFTYKWEKQLFYGILFSFIAFLIGFIMIYYTLQSGQRLYLITFKFQLPDNESLYIALFFLLTIINPILSMIYWIGVPLDTQKHAKKLKICLYYGLFHGLIVNIFKNSLSGLLFGLLYTGIGFLLVVLKEKFGLITGTLTYMGLNLSYSLGFILIIKEQKRFFL